MTTFTTEDRIKAEKIEDVILDAQDAFYVFDDEQGNIFTDDDRLLFCEGYNQGVEAMRKATLTLLDKLKD
jgi:hypothetical protein